MVEQEKNIMIDDKRLYEGMYVLRASLSDEARDKALKKIEEGIAEQGGEILKTHDQGRKRLAYEICRQREGYYYLLYFKVRPAAIEHLQSAYHLMDDLLRFINLRATEVKETIEFKPVGEQS
jgi:small subunit ribosomal protein S6